MNWRLIGASTTGTSHSEQGRPCEDRCYAQTMTGASGLSLATLFVADGAGSATNGGAGADLAIQSAVRFIEQQLTLPEFTLCEQLAVACIDFIRQQIAAQANLSGLQSRDYACTFLGLITSKMGTLIMQIGDGGIVIDLGKGLQVPIMPMSGEYANMTHFVTDEDAQIHLAIRVLPDMVVRAAVFSDGLQRLALNMSDYSAHVPFFAPFFQVMASAKADQEDQFNDALTSFLQSPAVNRRTDDDKTLTLALWRE